MTFVSRLESAASRLTDPGVLLDLAAGGIGVGLTVIPEQFAFTRARAVFGNNSGGKAALTLAQFAARLGLFAAEAVAGMAASEQGGPVGVASEGFAAAAMWHAIRTAKTQFVGTQPVLGFAF